MYRILVVDDEPHIRQGIADKIEQFDSSFAVCGSEANGSDALKWLESHDADICITDIRMPVMDGLDLVRQLQRGDRRILSIIVSSYDDFAYAKQAIELDVSDYILKPIDRAGLQKSLEHAAATIEKKRTDEANRLLVQKIGQYGDLLDRWHDVILTRQTDKYSLLVVDTLHMLESWVDGRYVWLDGLAAAWIRMVAAEVKLQAADDAGLPDSELGFDSPVLPLDQVRSYYRLRAVMRMEMSILRFFEQIGKSSQHVNMKLINTVKQYIDRHFTEKLNVEELADMIPVSRSYLTVLFKQGTGQTIWSYVTDVRMKHAKMLLGDGQWKVYEIANRIGYENCEHFTKVFKEYYGVTPKEFRRRLNDTADKLPSI